MRCIQHYEINQNVLGHLIIVDMLDTWHPGQQLMITIPNQKHVTSERFQIRILLKEVLKNFDFRSLVTIPISLVCFQNLLLTFLVQWKNIEDLVTFSITSMNSLFHLKHVNLKGKTHN
jgi:hypothetical protein